MSQLLRKHVRALDLVGRLGGDEFLVILPMTSPQEGMVFVQRVQQAMQGMTKSHPEFGRTSLSFGIAEAPRDGLTTASVLAAADAALYSAKRRGGDLVVSTGDA